MSIRITPPSCRREYAEPIDSAIAYERWIDARPLIKAALRREPGSHRLRALRAGIGYEQRDYPDAFAPKCPLLWEYAETLLRLGKAERAFRIYFQIAKRYLSDSHAGECNASPARVEGLYADCAYRVAKCFELLEDLKSAEMFVRMSLAHRGPECESIYPIEDVTSYAAKVAELLECQLERKRQLRARRRRPRAPLPPKARGRRTPP